LNAVSKLGHWDVFLVLVQILVLRKSGEVAMVVVGTTVHQTKKVQSVKVQRGIELQQSKDANGTLKLWKPGL